MCQSGSYTPPHRKIAPGHVRPVAARIPPVWNNNLVEQRTDSQLAVLLNSTHSLLARLPLAKSHRNLLLALWNETERSQGCSSGIKEENMRSK